MIPTELTTQNQTLTQSMSPPDRHPGGAPAGSHDDPVGSDESGGGDAVDDKSRGDVVVPGGAGTVVALASAGAGASSSSAGLADAPPVPEAPAGLVPRRQPAARGSNDTRIYVGTGYILKKRGRYEFGRPLWNLRDCREQNVERIPECQAAEHARKGKADGLTSSVALVSL